MLQHQIGSGPSCLRLALFAAAGGCGGRQLERRVGRLPCLCDQQDAVSSLQAVCRAVG